jgi:hypothetical protein
MEKMSLLKEGDHVQIVRRPVTAQDRKSGRYFEHMAGLKGIVQNIYGPDEIVVKIEPECLNEIAKDVHEKSVVRMREKFLGSLSEEQKSKLTPEELNFSAHYVLLVRSEDLQKI